MVLYRGYHWHPGDRAAVCVVGRVMDDPNDHDLLVVAVTELKHIKKDVAELVSNGKVQNGRLSALEKWRWTVSGSLVLIGTGWPLLIYEVRQFLLEKFGFIP